MFHETTSIIHYLFKVLKKRWSIESFAFETTDLGMKISAFHNAIRVTVLHRFCA